VNDGVFSARIGSADELRSLYRDPSSLGLLLVLPGRDETLRIDGDACVTTDPDVLGLWDDELRAPEIAIGIEVANAFIHCAKSFRRGRVWDTSSWSQLDAPDACEVLVSNLGLEMDPADVRRVAETEYAADLDAERLAWPEVTRRPRGPRCTVAPHGGWCRRAEVGRADPGARAGVEHRYADARARSSRNPRVLQRAGRGGPRIDVRRDR
jgi:hypothetical protein